MNKVDPRGSFLELVTLAFDLDAIKKLVFSRPTDGEIAKVSARLCAHRQNKFLAFEYSLPGNTVSQKNLARDSALVEVEELLKKFRQANLITTAGDAEYKLSKGERDVLLGGGLKSKLCGDGATFERALDELERKKNYLLTGSEDFLIALGVSDKSGRVHDKKQGKFRQINRFIEHIEDIYGKLPREGNISVYDLCCGKSYLSFAVYYYLTAVKGRGVKMLGVDLKRDVISWCAALAARLGYSGMQFICGDISAISADEAPDMVISLHACDVATDIVINRAIALGAKIILSTPCCHRYLNGKISAEALRFVTEYPHLKNKLCEAITDAIRLSRLSAAGYKVTALELTDPENTPKNTLLRAVREENVNGATLDTRKQKYTEILKFVLGEGASTYLDEIK
ncbi:MAG: SAM-dependent methyltransferase [Clostridia bacterium]|nr:SAM-dependent methyltransferase [Clostridia bacterium]